MLATIETELPEIKSTIRSLIKINNIRIIKMNEVTWTKRIGEGGQSTVYEGYFDNNHSAVKIITNIDWKSLMNELIILSNWIHPSIPKFHGIVNDDKTLALIFEYIKGRTLDELRINELPFHVKLKIARTVSEVLEYMHINNFVHRDWKPSNVMVNDNMDTFWIDFGISKICINKRNAITLTKGTLNYLAPECLEIMDLNENEEIFSLITSKVDVWSFGCLISYLFSGIAPWENKFPGNDPAIQKALMDKDVFPIPDKIKEHEKLKEIVEKSTRVDYKERISIKDVTDLLYDIDAEGNEI